MRHAYIITRSGKLHKGRTVSVTVKAGNISVGTVTVFEPCDKEYQIKALDGQKIKITL